MHPLAEEYLQQKERAAHIGDAREKEIRDFLIEEGLYEIEYSPYDHITDEYNLFSRTEMRYYRIVPIPVTWEEYIRLYNAREALRERKKCAAASHVQTCGITVFVLGAVLGGLTLGNLLIALLVWFAALISGTILLALSKLIDQLDQLRQIGGSDVTGRFS